MRAEITQLEKGYKALFERQLAQETDKVWNMLADNSLLKQWFAELQIAEPGKGGKLVFDMGDGSIEELAITDYEEGRVLAFEWWDDHVRFEVEEGNGRENVLRLIETIERITDQTAKDLAGWHVCLDVIEAILNGREINREEEWQHLHDEYKRLLDSMTVEFE
ncbi:SRPBCC domain-containing protein [Planomicrobium sp. Y74]|uniref:SRPBCC domain-containing protein n=1 Tax=Planomicrobium sp. Y74 TaxID=2478977 RepID=UPI000EF4FD16|nr:SRPBCC domain-containing protein [Planomicrobium sp. Y74]RLQ86614.1 activator of Hsp90 ATPase 1 family protein [Planomicrobium sp. Y74]